MNALSGSSFCSLKARLCREDSAFEWSGRMMTQLLTSTSIIGSNIFRESPGKSFRLGKRGGPSVFRTTPSCSFLRSWNALSLGLVEEAALERLSLDEDVLAAVVEVGVSGSCCVWVRRLRILRAVSASFLGFLDDGETLLLLERGVKATAPAPIRVISGGGC